MNPSPRKQAKRAFVFINVLVLVALVMGGLGLGASLGGWALFGFIFPLIMIRVIASRYFSCPHCYHPAEIYKDKVKFCPSCGLCIDPPNDSDAGE